MLPFRSFRKHSRSEAGNALLFIILGIAVILLIGIFLFISRGSNKSIVGIKTQPSPTLSAKSNPTQSLQVLPAPTVNFASYQNQTTTPAIPSGIKSYALKTNFNSKEIASFAANFGLSIYTDDGKPILIVSNLTDKYKRGILSFARVSGAFSYQSFGAIWPKQYHAGQSVVDETNAYIKELGFTDGTITCTTEYERQDVPGTTFVECHRDWQKLSLPLVNMVGLLNLPESSRIANAAAGTVSQNGPIDLAVMHVSNDQGGSIAGANQKARPDDFNTITIGIRQDGRIASVVSTMRWVSSAPTTVAASALVSPQEALQAFKDQKASFSLTLPAGGGLTSWQKVYPGNVAQASKAVITDMSLAYVEKPLTVTVPQYDPYYIIRGTAQLASGYTVRFTQAMPAVKRNSLSILSEKVGGTVAGVATEITLGKLNLNTFEIPQGSSSPGSSPTPSPSTPGQTNPPVQCTTETASQIAKIDVPGYGTVIVGAYGQDLGPTGAARGINGDTHTYFLQSSPSSNPDKASIKKAFFKAVEDQYVINVAQWVQQHDNKITSLDDVKAIFGTMNPGYSTDLKCEDYNDANPKPAPIANCRTDTPENYDEASAKQVADNVAKRIFDAMGNGSITAIAGQQDIFPGATIQNLNWVFFSYPDPGSLGTGGSDCYITGESPALFFYTDHTMPVTVETGAKITYADPALSQNQWLGTVHSDGSFSSDAGSRPYLYYEYDKATTHFTQSAMGYSISTNDTTSFITQTLSPKLGLNSQETLRMVLEVKNALTGINAPYVKLSLIDPKELDQQLPLRINPMPVHLYRLHLLLTPLQAPLTLQAPNLIPITHDPFTVVELGATAY